MTRFPESMLASQSHRRLIEHLGVTIVADVDAELADYARAWLVDVEQVNPPTGQAGYIPTHLVSEALERFDERRTRCAQL